MSSPTPTPSPAQSPAPTHAFEDFSVGQVREFGSRLVDREEGLAFAAAYDP